MIYMTSDHGRRPLTHICVRIYCTITKSDIAEPDMQHHSIIFFFQKEK